MKEEERSNSKTEKLGVSLWTGRPERESPTCFVEVKYL